MDSYEAGYFVGRLLSWMVLIGIVFFLIRFIIDLFRYLKPDNAALKELKNIILFNEMYEKGTIDGYDFSLPLYYLKVHNGEKEFNSAICLSKSELEAFKTVYTVQFEYITQKVYSLELKKNDLKILEEVEVTLQEVWEDEELKSSFYYRLEDGITPYGKSDFNYIDEKCELIWDINTTHNQFLIKRKDKILLPKEMEKEGKFNMPFHFCGGSRVMVDCSGKYGVIYSKEHYKKMDYKVLYDFKYHYIRSDGFGNVEMLENKIEHNGDYKKLICDMAKISDEKKEIKKVLLNSTTKDEYITIDSDGLLRQHCENGVSKLAYKTIILNFHKIKPVQYIDGKWGYLDKNGSELIDCIFFDWNFFHGDYAVIKEARKKFLIDHRGAIVTKPADEVIYYENNMYFIKDDDKWAVYKGKDVYIDFIDTKKIIDDIKKEHNLKDKEIYKFLEEQYCTKTGYMWLNANSPEEIILRDAIVEKKRELHKQKYELPLKEYVKLYDTFTSDKELRETGLWKHKVKIKDGKIGHIGWSYPASASLYDMSVELPVDGFGVSLEELELIKG